MMALFFTYKWVSLSSGFADPIINDAGWTDEKATKISVSTCKSFSILLLDSKFYTLMIADDLLVFIMRYIAVLSLYIPHTYCDNIYSNNNNSTLIYTQGM